MLWRQYYSWIAVGGLIVSLVAVGVGQEKPAGFEQILARGGIPAIDHPSYVAANEAKIDDDSFVLGVVIEGRAMAYSLNLLNRHEVVNDTVGDTNFAAVW